MESLHKKFMAALEKIIKENPGKAENMDLSKIISNITLESASLVKESLIKSTKSMLQEKRKSNRSFCRLNLNRWANAFDVLETHIAICTEAGWRFNNEYRAIAVENENLVFDLVVRHHARACQISEEILCLLKAGFADAAHARWRALHEVAATAIFISKHGRECAERFYYHEIIESYKGMLMHQQYESRLQAKGHSLEEIAKCKQERDKLVDKYGKSYADGYGWAAYLFQNSGRITFDLIEKDVNLDHMRPYYKWASQNIHASSKGMRNRLGLCDTKEDLLLAGASSSGMADPAHAAAISLNQITNTLLLLEPTLDHIITMKIIEDYTTLVGEYFLEKDKYCD